MCWKGLKKYWRSPMKPKLLYIIALLLTIETLAFIELDKQHSATITALSAENATLQQNISTLQSAVDAQLKAIERLTKESAQLKAQQTKPAEAQKTNRGGEREHRIMEVTAYWEGSCGKKPSDPLYGITASGKRVQDGFVAAWTEEYPIGTKLYIPYFDRVFTVMDTGGDITEGRLDVYMPTAKECFRFGRKWLEVWEVE
jgi:3D (Asp-Asp-Asp) domain-containing protein